MRAGRLALAAVAAGVGYAVGRRRRGGPTADPTTVPATVPATGPGAVPATLPGADPGADRGRPIPDAEEVPGIGAETPAGIPAAGWRQVVRRAWRETRADGIPLLAAGVAFFGFLALFPALIAAVALYGLVADPAQVEEQVRSLSEALPAESATLIGDQLRDITSTSDRALGLGLLVSVLGALFTASGGVANLIKATNLAYDEQETRGFARLRALALLLTLGSVVFIVVAVGLVAVLPVALDQIGLGAAGEVAVGVLRWLGLVVFMTGALAVLYRIAPDRADARFSWVTLGAAVATVLWLLGSVGFSVYVGNFGSYGETYGALAGVVVLMLWLFLTAFVVLLGAEINAEAEQQTVRDSTVGPPKPLGSRNAVKADSIPTPGD
ncbi:MAG TPA: YihY/virulence factor BrkB family protein [Mycobacteriales bacterium]|nr:YihY/virulence factor BrkB family protein [Mycobacteriales bacterium]